MRINSFRFNLHELGGALGDLGTLLPLIVVLITLNHMNATSVFLVVGLAHANPLGGREIVGTALNRLLRLSFAPCEESDLLSIAAISAGDRLGAIAL